MGTLTWDTSNPARVEGLIREALGWMRCEPLPSQEELDRYYRDEFYQSAYPDYLESQKRDLVWNRDCTFSDRLSYLDMEPGTLLDVGCGPGHWMRYAQEQGWSPWGVDLSPTARTAAAKATGGQVFTYIPDNVQGYDAVTVVSLLEHVRHPRLILTAVGQSLRPGGKVLVVVPNDFSPFQLKLEASCGRYWVADAHLHLHYWTFTGMERLMEEAGFTIERRFTTYPMELFALQGRRYMLPVAYKPGQKFMGRECHRERVVMEKDMGQTCRRRYYKALANAGLGRHVGLVGVKR